MDLSHLKPTKEEVEFQRELRNRIIDNISELKRKKYTAGSETLDKILLDFYKMLYDERNPVQQDKFETAAFIIDFFQSYTKKLSKTFEDLERQFKDRKSTLDRCNEDNYDLQANVKTLNSKIEDLNKKLKHKDVLIQEADDNINAINLQSKELQKNFDQNTKKYKDVLFEANKQMEIKNLEMLDLSNRIKNLESQLRMSKEDQAKSIEEIERTRAMMGHGQVQNKNLRNEIKKLQKKIKLLTREKEHLAKKVIEQELMNKNVAALTADLETSKQVNRRQNKELGDLKRKFNSLKIESETLKTEKEGLEDYLRNMKHNMSIIQDSIEDPVLSSYLAKKPKPFVLQREPVLMTKGKARPDESRKYSPNFGKQTKDKFEKKEAERHSSPKTNIPEYYGGNYNQFNHGETWKNIGKYKGQDKNSNQSSNNEENGPLMEADMAQWDSSTERIKELDQELTKFQRVKVLIENDLCQIKIAPSSKAVRLKIY